MLPIATKITTQRILTVPIPEAESRLAEKLGKAEKMPKQTGVKPDLPRLLSEKTAPYTSRPIYLS